jgi:hypothetical protein
MLNAAPSGRACAQHSAARLLASRQLSHRGIRRKVLFVRGAAATAAATQVEAPATAEVVEPVFPVLPPPGSAHFEHDNTVFVEEFRIRGNEAGPDQRANIITIANLLQVRHWVRVGGGGEAGVVAGHMPLWVLYEDLCNGSSSAWLVEL